MNSRPDSTKPAPGITQREFDRVMRRALKVKPPAKANQAPKAGSKSAPKAKATKG